MIVCALRQLCEQVADNLNQLICGDGGGRLMIRLLDQNGLESTCGVEQRIPALEKNVRYSLRHVFAGVETGQMGIRGERSANVVRRGRIGKVGALTLSRRSGPRCVAVDRIQGGPRLEDS